MNRGEIIARGVEAKALLENETLNAAFDDMLMVIYEEFLRSRTDSDQILDLHKQAIAIKSVRGTLNRYMDDTKVEEANKKAEEEQ